jgi:prevent-host-death family protein
MARQGKPVEIDSAAIDRLVSEAAGGLPVVLTRDGRPVAAVVDIAFLDRLSSERELLRRLALGELESAVGDGFELEAVLEECRMLLEEN